MIVKSLKAKPVVTKITRGKIHGQGNYKRYTFILLETSAGNSFAELYCGTYDFELVTAIVKSLEKKLVGRELALQDVLDNTLHQPFISGAGVHQAVISSIYNCILLLDLNWILDLEHSITSSRTYISGGTVKSSIEEMKLEIEFARSLELHHYKVRLDYRDLNSSLEKIEFLNRQSINYAIDLIINTNYIARKELPLSRLVERIDTSKLLWLEEPVFPTEPEEWDSVLHICREAGITVALGESLTSKLELEYVLNHQMIEMVQIDATHNSDLLALQDVKRRVLERGKILGFHNWGSYATLIMNGLLNENPGESFFEIPFYQTEFDEMLIQKLDCSVECLTNPRLCFGDLNCVRDNVFQLVLVYEERDYKDFSWT